MAVRLSAEGENRNYMVENRDLEIKREEGRF
jgi:hypothetical protein